MRQMFRIAVGAAGLCLVAGSALAQFPPITDPSKGEAACQSNAGKVLSKFVSSKTKCIDKCIKTARKTSGPYSGCLGPAFTDPATNTCIFEPTKGAEAKARAGIVKKCMDQPGKDNCPECYGQSLCNTGEPFVTDVEGQIDPFGNLLYCLEAGGTTPTKGEAKCEDGTVKALVKFVGSKVKCYDKCFKNEQKGKIAPGTCLPPASDVDTVACIDKAETKAVSSIDKVCEDTLPGKPENEKPACYGATTGAGWVALVESNVDFRVPITSCGSPSGAFLD